MTAQTSILDEIIVDNFAGGGGASTGIELATGRPVTIAINHDPAAILSAKSERDPNGTGLICTDDNYDTELDTFWCFVPEPPKEAQG